MRWDSSAIAKHLPANIFTDGSGAIQLQKHVGLQGILGPVDLEISDAGAKPHPLLSDVENHHFLVHFASHKVNSPKTSVLVAGVEGLEGAAQTHLGTVIEN